MSEVIYLSDVSVGDIFYKKDKLIQILSIKKLDDILNFNKINNDIYLNSEIIYKVIADDDIQSHHFITYIIIGNDKEILSREFRKPTFEDKAKIQTKLLSLRKEFDALQRYFNTLSDARE